MRTAWLVLLLCACSSSHKPGPGDDPTDAPGPVIDGSVGTTCGGLGSLRCASDEYCDYATNSCGFQGPSADEAGTCVKRPEACPAVISRDVCGCDGKVHASACAAYADGTDLAAGGGCAKQAGKFECGYLQCELATDYCRREPHARGPETFTCVPLPACAAAPSCGCLAGERCGRACTGDDRLGLTVTCPATP